MSKGWTFAAGVAGACGIGACALVTHFDPPITPDGGTSCDGNADGGCPPMALLCEDFENGSMDGKWTTQPQNNGEWDIDNRGTNPVHGGQHSLHLHTDGSPAGGGSQTAVAWELMTQGWNFPLYLRAFVYWKTPLAYEVANFLQLQAARSINAGFALYAGQTQLGWTNWGDNVSRGLPVPPSPGAWHCVEWQFNGAGGKDVEVFFDGQKNSSLGDTNTPTFGFSELDVGLLLGTEPEPAMDLYIDDVVLANSPIGCCP